MKARTEEFVFHRMNDLQWRLGIVEENHSRTLTNGEKQTWARRLIDNGFILVRQEEAGDFEVWGREADVDLEPIPDCLAV